MGAEEEKVYTMCMGCRQEFLELAHTCRPLGSFLCGLTDLTPVWLEKRMPPRATCDYSHLNLQDQNHWIQASASVLAHPYCRPLPPSDESES